VTLFLRGDADGDWPTSLLVALFLRGDGPLLSLRPLVASAANWPASLLVTLLLRGAGELACSLATRSLAFSCSLSWIFSCSWFSLCWISLRRHSMSWLGVAWPLETERSLASLLPSRWIASLLLCRWFTRYLLSLLLARARCCGKSESLLPDRLCGSSDVGFAGLAE